MPLITIPAAVGTGMTAAQAAAAAAAAAQAATAATAATTAATTAAAAAAPTVAATTAAAPTLAATTAGSVAPGAFGAGITGGGTGAGLTAGASGAGGAGITAGGGGAGAGIGAGGAGSVAPGAFGAGTGGAGGAGAGAGGAGTIPGATGAETLTANAGQGIMTDAGAMQSGAVEAGNVPINEAGRAQIEQLVNGTGSFAPPTAPPTAPPPNIAPNAPFAQNPIGDPNIANTISNASPPTLPGDPSSAAPYDWSNPVTQNKLIDPSIQNAQNAANATSTSYADTMAPNMPGGTGAELPGTGNALERGIKSAVQFAKDNPYTMMTATTGINYLMQPGPPEKKKYKERDLSGFQRSEPSTSEYTPIYEPASYAAKGGLMSYAVGGPVEQMSAMNATGANTGYPQARLQTPMYANPMMQRPEATNVIAPSADAGVNTYTGEARFADGGGVPAVEKLEARNRKLLGIKTPQEVEEDFDRSQDVMRREGFGIVTDSDVDTRRKSPAEASMTQLKKIGKRIGMPVSDMPKSAVVDTDVFHAAQGGITYGLGGYSDGGRLLKGPGDGVSDSIPASIGGRQPARLADGEFVVPARIVSELGNGSTEAGARKLYAMMERVQASRKKSIGKKKVAVNSKADKHLPA